jgi:pimeloyl-ACP methyl ester carboxylesterase
MLRFYAMTVAQATGEITLNNGRFYQTPPPPPAPITIIHGREDEVVPFAASREYARAYPDQVQLIEVTAGHDINAHLPLIWETLQQVCLAA